VRTSHARRSSVAAPPFGSVLRVGDDAGVVNDLVNQRAVPH
jgi:hypothetical protein